VNLAREAIVRAAAHGELARAGRTGERRERVGEIAHDGRRARCEHEIQPVVASHHARARDVGGRHLDDQRRTHRRARTIIERSRQRDRPVGRLPVDDVAGLGDPAGVLPQVGHPEAHAAVVAGELAGEKHRCFTAGSAGAEAPEWRRRPDHRRCADAKSDGTRPNRRPFSNEMNAGSAHARGDADRFRSE
jgi:hypothetical protein